MGRKKKHPEHVNHERWLVSYADFITLLFAFFVVLFSSSQVDRSKTNKMSLAIEAAFSRFSMFKQTGGEMNLIATENKTGQTSSRASMISQDGTPLYRSPEVIEEEQGVKTAVRGPEELNQNVGPPASESVLLEHARRDIVKLLEQRKMHNMVHVDIDTRGIVIRIREAGIFAAGTEVMSDQSAAVLRGIAHVLHGLPNQVLVEGHGDAQTVKNTRFLSNWELSAARAAYVTDFLTTQGMLDPKRFVVVGYGDYRPIASNDTEEGRERNRRVDIVIVSKKASAQAMPLDVPTTEPIKIPWLPTRTDLDGEESAVLGVVHP